MILTTLVYLVLAANPPSLPPGKAKAIVEHECAGCHVLKVVTLKRASKEQWSVLVDQMISRGADVPDEEIETVVDYLAKNFGPAKGSATVKNPAVEKNPDRHEPVNVNTATAAQLSKALGLSPEQSSAIVSYRQQHGNFKEWHDLTKVRGIEGEKIEPCKDRLAF
jgi:competence ComEA-like helix-hairpin-helix protein